MHKTCIISLDLIMNVLKYFCICFVFNKTKEEKFVYLFSALLVVWK
jgi:hypothetical protein